MSGRYSAGLNSHGANVPSYPTKAEALKAAKDAARAQPGALAVFHGETTRRGSLSTDVERRYFRADPSGKVREVML